MAAQAEPPILLVSEPDFAAHFAGKSRHPLEPSSSVIGFHFFPGHSHVPTSLSHLIVLLQIGQWLTFTFRSLITFNWFALLVNARERS